MIRFLERAGKRVCAGVYVCAHARAFFCLHSYGPVILPCKFYNKADGLYSLQGPFSYSKRSANKTELYSPKQFCLKESKTIHTVSQLEYLKSSSKKLEYNKTDRHVNSSKTKLHEGLLGTSDYTFCFPFQTRKEPNGCHSYSKNLEPKSLSKRLKHLKLRTQDSLFWHTTF